MQEKRGRSCIESKTKSNRRLPAHCKGLEELQVDFESRQFEGLHERITIAPEHYGCAIDLDRSGVQKVPMNDFDVKALYHRTRPTDGSESRGARKKSSSWVCVQDSCIMVMSM